VTVSLEQIQLWLEAKEDEHLKCKEAKQNFHFETLVRYCVALANEGGGCMILGVSDQPPRRVVGSNVFANLERPKAGLIERLRLRIEAEEVHHPQGRILVFQVPSRPLEMPIQYKGAYWVHGGQDLVAMTPDRLRAIFAESGPDFLAEICP
jgi:ATP-dependent DNA helicase RecG